MTLTQDKPIVAQNGTNNGGINNAAANTATIKQWVSAMVKGDLDHAPYAEDAETSDPSGKYKGKTQILQSFKVWKTAFPQGTAEVTNQIAQGDQVASEVVYKATHTGPLVAPASGTAARISQLSFTVFPVLMPPYSVTPPRGRTFTVRS